MMEPEVVESIMSPTVLAALIAGIASLIGTFGGILVSSKLTIYRIEQLEKKVDRFTAIESQINALITHNELQDERIRTVTENAKEIKEELKNGH